MRKYLLLLETARKFLAIVSIAILFTNSAFATLVVNNGNFSDTSGMTDAGGGWYHGALVGPWNATGSDQFMINNNAVNLDGKGTISQTLGTVEVGGEIITVSFEYGDMWNGGYYAANEDMMTAEIFDATAGVVLESKTVKNTGLLGSLISSSLSTTATVGNTIEIRFTGLPGNGVNSGSAVALDNVSVSTEAAPVPVIVLTAPTIVAPLNNSITTAANLVKVDWTDVTDGTSPITYVYSVSNSDAVNPDGTFTTPLYTSEALADSEIPALGTPEGVYYFSIKATDSVGNMSPWTTPSKVTVDNDYVELTAPSITAPINEAYYTTTPITSMWTAVDGAAKYQVWYDYDDGHTFAGGPETCPDVATGGCRETTDLSRDHSPGNSEKGGVTVRIRAIGSSDNLGPWSAPVHYYYVDKVPSTIVVKSDTSAGENMPGWLFNRDTSTSSPYEFVGITPSIGIGGLYVEPIGTNPADKFIGEYFFDTTNVKMADIETISYDFQIGSGGQVSNASQFYMNVYANFGASPANKYYDCKYDVVPTVGTVGAYTTVTFDPTATYTVKKHSTSPSLCPASPADMGPGAVIRAIALNLGDTTASDAGIDGFFDNVIITTKNAITTYDFEGIPPVVPGSVVNYPITQSTTATENDAKKWFFGRDPANRTSYSFIDEQKILGEGALKVDPIGTINSGDKFIGEYFLLENVHNTSSVALDYRLADSVGANKVNHVYMTIYANFDNSNDYGHCVYSVVATDGTPGWHTLKFDPKSAYSVRTRGSAPSACPAKPSDLPVDAQIRAVAINVGDTSLNDAGVSVYLDNVVVKTSAETSVYDFEPLPIPACDGGDTTFDTFSLGNVNGQFGWASTGPFDQAIVKNIYGVSSFGCKSLRISNAVTQGAFGNQTFSYSTVNEAGETSAENNSLSGGVRQNRFEAEFDFASASPNAEQAGLSVAVSPDRGDGARMSWAQVTDTPTGLAVNFYEYVAGAPDTGAGDGFVFTNIASGLDRATAHNIKIIMDLIDGSGNDIVQVYVDDTLVHTGTSWEDYFRIGESKPTRTVDSLLFRVSGTAAPSNVGRGFLFDNVVLSTSKTPIAGPTLTLPADGTIYATADLPKSQKWTAVSGATKYVYESYTVDPIANPGAIANYTQERTTTSRTIGATAAEGKYWWRVKAKTPAGDSEWSNVYTFIVDNTPPTPPADTTPPVISNITTEVLYPAGLSIRWTTDEPATSQIKYGLTNNYGSESAFEGTLKTEHVVNLSGLDSPAEYYFEIVSADGGGNVASSNTSGSAATNGGGSGGVSVSGSSTFAERINPTTPSEESAPEEIPTPEEATPTESEVPEETAPTTDSNTPIPEANPIIPTNTPTTPNNTPAGGTGGTTTSGNTPLFNPADATLDIGGGNAVEEEVIPEEVLDPADATLDVGGGNAVEDENSYTLLWTLLGLIALLNTWWFFIAKKNIPSVHRRD